MVKWALLVLVFLGGCSSVPDKPCKPVVVNVPVIVKPDIPRVDRPELLSNKLGEDAGVDIRLKTMQRDVLYLREYAISLEKILRVIEDGTVD